MKSKSSEKIVFIDGGVCAAQGFYAAGMYAGFKVSKRKDLAVVYSDKICDAAAAYTTNKVKGATLKVTMEHLKSGKAQAIVTNSGYANTLAPNGMEVAEKTCDIAGEALGIKADDVVVCSTGMIGRTPSLEPFEKNVPKLSKIILDGVKGNINEKYFGAGIAAEAIMTTDTFKKEAAVEFTLDGKTCRIGAMAKGSGMINPNMATMLVFITSDVNISARMLRNGLKNDINQSFNQISVDGDTSTNDTIVIMANGKARNKRIDSFNENFYVFASALNKVTMALSRMLAKDGEGATKLIECLVENAPTDDIAKKIAKTVIQSELVKTAIYGSDANWGRIMCAVGYTPGNFNVDNSDVIISSAAGEVKVCESSFAVHFDEALAKKVLDEDEILITVNLHDGTADARAFGCDLTYDYVKINGKYRT